MSLFFVEVVGLRPIKDRALVKVQVASGEVVA